MTKEDIKKIGEDLRDEIIKIYFQKKYYTSLAKMEDVKDGKIVINIIEGILLDIDIENEKDLRLRKSYISRRIRLGAGTPLNIEELESYLKLLQDDPLIDHIEASLKPSGQKGKTNLSVRVEEANPFLVNLSFDNYSPASVGSDKFGVVFGHRNLTRRGDQLKGAYYRSTTGGSNLVDVSYELPLNAMDGALLMHGARFWTKITQSEFDEFDIEGEKDLYEIRYRQPVFRTYRQEFALSVGFTFQDGQTFIFENIGTPFGRGPDENGKSRTSVLKFGQEYTFRGATTVGVLRSQLSMGTSLFDATDNLHPIPDGHFVSWLGQLFVGQRLGKLRLGPINSEHALIVQAEAQLTSYGLLASEQFVIGGPLSVRGYRQNVRTGDNGFRVSLEDRIAVLHNKAGVPYLQILPFVDIGSAWNVSSNPNEQQDQRFLIGAGAGLLFEIGQLWDSMRDFTVRLDYGYPFIKLDDKGDNLQDEGFYFSLNYQPNKIIEKFYYAKRQP